MMDGQALVAIAQMPLAENGRVVTSGLQNFGQRFFLGVQTNFGTRAKRAQNADTEL